MMAGPPHLSNKGVASGLATLGSDGKLTAAQRAIATGNVGAAVINLGAMTSVQSVEVTAPTTAQYNALQVDAAANRTKLNALLTSLRNAGLIAP